MSLLAWTLCLFSCWARIVMLVQHAVPVALSGGMGRGLPVPILPENVCWDVQGSGAGCPPGPVRPSPASYVREMLRFLPSSCFLPDGNSLPNFLLLLPPLGAQTHAPTETARGVGQGKLGHRSCIAAAPRLLQHMARGGRELWTGPPHICPCAQEGFYFLSLCVIILGVSGC